MPYCDFNVFGPHGLRHLREAVFTSYVLNAAGEWSKRAVPGRTLYIIFAWERSFRTFKTTMLLLDAAEPERLDAYSDHIGGERWGVVQVAS